jgi:hypothetical protein
MLIGAAGFLLLFLLMLAVPITLNFRLSWRQRFRSDVEVRWLFGLVHLRIPSPRSFRPIPAGAKRPNGAGGSQRPYAAKRNVLAALGERRLRRRIIAFAGDLWRAVHKRDVRVRVRVGLGDPADTGLLWGVLGPVSALAAGVRGASISVEPDFVDSTFEMEGSGCIRIVPIQMTYLFAALLLSPAIWRAVRQQRSVPT